VRLKGDILKNIFEEGLLRYLSIEQLEKIQSTKIGIAGVGGLGSNIAQILVRTGFVDFEIIDDDIVDSSNLNRQNYFIDEIGLAKVVTTARRLQKINPAVKVNVINVRLTKDNLQNFFQDRDVLFEAFDNTESKIMFLEFFGNTEKLLIFGNGMSGVVGEEIKIRKMRDNLFIVGDGITEVGKNNPPLAHRVMTCASLMASIAIERNLA